MSVFSCQRTAVDTNKQTIAPQTLRDVPAQRLNFRFESDVPAPTETSETAQSQERNAAVQNDFDQNRPQELLDKSITAPNQQRVLAIYHKVEDLQGDFRLDIYSADGRLLKKITHNGMAVHYPDTIVWSPDSGTVAFMAKTRVGQSEVPSPENTPNQPKSEANTSQNTEANTNSETAAANENENANASAATTPATDSASAPPVLTFRTEQIYISDASGTEVKPLTQNEGLIYFYFVWSPDSSMLASLATTYQEWNFLQYQADSKGESFVPMGRPRLLEKTGRERRLDDNLTKVHPVWSPDSAKVADAFDTQIRIYDAIGNAPTQAAIPLRNQLLISSKAFDEKLRKQEQEGNTNTNTETSVTPLSNVNESANAAPNQPIGTLPDESTLVSFNPLINLEWTQDSMLYLQTGYIKQMKNEADSARSYLRWHRLIFSPQAVAMQ